MDEDINDVREPRRGQQASWHPYWPQGETWAFLGGADGEWEGKRTWRDVRQDYYNYCKTSLGDVMMIVMMMCLFPRCILWYSVYLV